MLCDTNLDGQVLDELLISGNDWDCANQAYPSNPYMGARIRCASSSRAIKISNNIVRGAHRAFYIAAGASIEIADNLVVDCAALFHSSLTGAIGALTIARNTGTGLSFAIGVFAFNTFTVARFVFTGNHLQGTGNSGFSGWTVGDANITIAMLTSNLIRMPGTFDWRRTVAAAPTMNAWYAGEIINRTDAAPHTYLAITVGQGAADWAPLGA